MNTKSREHLKTLFRYKLFRPLMSIRRFGRNVLSREPHWMRRIMSQNILEFYNKLNIEKLNALEISGTDNSVYNWKSYTSYSYPEFDLLNPGQIASQYDVVLCEQVLEHVQDPFQATRTLYDLIVPGGVLIVSTPFLIRLHGMPDDYWRFTPSGMMILLKKAGFESIKVNTWGNKRAVKNNLNNWQHYRFYHSLKNNVSIPVMVWAFARKPL